MRVSNREKALSRQRILDAAGKLFRENGVDGASVGDIMREAGMTHGGFYRHFADKEALLAATLTKVFEEFARPLVDAPDAEAGLAAFRNRYLSAEHLARPGSGCPAAAAGADIARQGLASREAFSEGVNLLAGGIARGLSSSANPRDESLRELAELVGAIILARAAQADLAKEILAACSRPKA